MKFIAQLVFSIVAVFALVAFFASGYNLVMEVPVNEWTYKEFFFAGFNLMILAVFIKAFNE
jgi:hypothetical protein